MLLNFFTCSTQLLMNFTMVTNVAMETIVGILTFNCMINTTSESVRERDVFNIELGRKQFYNLGAWKNKHYRLQKSQTRIENALIKYRSRGVQCSLPTMNSNYALVETG